MTFVGYSIPLTDISVTVLLHEALRDLPPEHIKIVDLAQTKTDRIRTQKHCREVLEKNIPDSNFYFDGALNWTRTLGN